jgi:hypothetical protein
MLPLKVGVCCAICAALLSANTPSVLSDTREKLLVLDG